MFDQDIVDGDVLEFIPETPIESIESVRFDVTDVQGWVIIDDIEILRD